jgi:acyl-coenzyme A thioesterase PaaI-like protein
MAVTGNKLKRFLKFWPPYLGAGIKINSISDDWKNMVVSMKLHWYNRNAVGTHFGGSLSSMVDPHYMLMLLNILGKEYVVWDLSCCIEFVKASKEPVKAEFVITDEIINTIKEKTKNGEKYLPNFELDIIDAKNNVVAKVKKTLYIRLKQA